MTGHIFILQDDESLIEMNEEAFPNEDAFQELLERHPNLLAGDQIDSDDPRRWLLIRREMGVPEDEVSSGRWSLDHLYLDQDGIPTLVEVKRSSDTRIRREVIGQMLDYAANAVVYWSVEQIVAEFERQCEANDVDPEQRLQEFLADGQELDDFWRKVKTNLQAGKVRMLFVADAIPKELRRIVEFLNVQMDPAEVLAIEIKHFVGSGMKTLVPRVIGQTAEAESRKAKGTPTTSTKQRVEGLLRMAEEKGVLDLYQSVVARLRPLFDSSGPSQSTVAFYGKIPSVKSGAAMFTVIPGESQPGLGLRVRIHIDRISQFFHVTPGAVLDALPQDGQFQSEDNWTREYHSGYLADEFSLDRLIDLFVSATRDEQDKQAN